MLIENRVDDIRYYRQGDKEGAWTEHYDELFRKELCRFILDSPKIHAKQQALKKEPEFCCICGMQFLSFSFSRPVRFFSHPSACCAFVMWTQCNTGCF
jgi:hypothetical protein